MNKLIKTLLIAIASLVVVAILAVFILFAVVDPNRYKPALSRVLQEQTGLELTIAGDISWTFRPVFGLSIEDVRLRNGVTPQELASFSTVSLKVSPASIINGPLQIEEFVATNLNINWIVDSNGQSNWFPEGEPASSTTPPASTESSGDINVEIQQIRLQNARINVQNAQSGINTTLENLSITSNNTNFSNRPFPFEVSFRLLDNAAGLDLPVSLSSTAAVDMEAGNISLTDMEASLSPASFTGNVSVKNFNDEMSWEGMLQSNSFNLSHFMENFLPPETQNPIPGDIESGGMLTASISFNGDSNGVSVPALNIQLDDMQINTDVEYRYATARQKARLAYTMTANALNLDALTAASTETGAENMPAPEDEQAPATASASTSPTDQEPIIPVELLNSMNIIGNHTIESLTAGGLQFEQIELRVTLEEGLLDIESQPIGFYDGLMVTAVQLDVRPAQPELSAAAAVENINMAALAGDMPFAEFTTGRLNSTSEYTLTGTYLDELLNSAVGSTSFVIEDNSVDITMVKQVFSAISALSPSGNMAQNWPDRLSFQQFDGSLTLTEGLASGQELALRLDNFEVTGTGGVDLQAGSFDYDVNFTVLGEPSPQTIAINPTYQGIAWPVSCEAEFSAPASQYCGPNFEAVRTVFGQIARNEVERRVEEAVSERIPEDLQDSARGLLRNLFRR